MEKDGVPPLHLALPHLTNALAMASCASWYGTLRLGEPSCWTPNHAQLDGQKRALPAVAQPSESQVQPFWTLSTSHVVVLQKAKAGPAPVQTAMPMPMPMAAPKLRRSTRDLPIHEALHVDHRPSVEPNDRGLRRGAAQGEGVRADPL